MALTRICNIVGFLVQVLYRWIISMCQSQSEIPTDSIPAQRACQKARSILDDLQASNFASISHEFTIPLRWLVTPKLLQTGWESIAVLAGPLISIGEPVARRGWFGTTHVSVPLHFKRMEMAIRIRMAGSGGLVALRIGFPTGAESEAMWHTPEYVDGDSFIEENIKLGTGWLRVGAALTIPKSACSANSAPCVVLIAGSGPCDRDSSVGALKPFRDIAWGLASRGVAVLRFDKVTCSYAWWFQWIKGHGSITLTDEYMDQTLDAMRYVNGNPNIDKGRVFVLGHSLGAWVAPRVAAMTNAAGLILMAAPARMIYFAALDQMRYLSSLEDDDERSSEAIEDLLRKIRVAESPNLTSSTPRKDLPMDIGAAYWLSMRTFEPLIEVKNLGKPVMILQGSRDFQVSVSEDYSRWLKELDGRSDMHTRLYDKLNHCFVLGRGPSTPAEYFEPGNIDMNVINDLARWVIEHEQQHKRA